MTKKLFPVILIILFTGFVVEPAHAQNKAGVGLIYGEDLGTLGPRADGVYTINRQFRIQGDLGFFWPINKGIFGEIDIFRWEVNVNGNYMTHGETGIALYALAGLNMATISIQRSIFENDTQTKPGLNIGGGVELPLRSINAFGEVKYVLGDFNQLGVAAGLRFPLKDRK